MSYVPQFTNISSIEALTGETIDNTTDPSAEQVLEWIEIVEEEMISRGFYQESLIGVIMDVPEGKAGRRTYTVNDMPPIVADASVYGGGRVIPLPHTPFISVANVQRNIQGYQSVESWESLTEGPGTGSHFLIMRKQYKAGLRGVALYFYSESPHTGFQRMKLDYIWGLDLPFNILREYAGARVSVMLLYSKYMRKEPIFNIDIAGLKSQLNKFTDVHLYILDRIETIEKEWLPQEIGIVRVP